MIQSGKQAQKAETDHQGGGSRRHGNQVKVIAKPSRRQCSNRERHVDWRAKRQSLGVGHAPIPGNGQRRRRENQQEEVIKKMGGVDKSEGFKA